MMVMTMTMVILTVLKIMTDDDVDDYAESLKNYCSNDEHVQIR